MLASLARAVSRGQQRTRDPTGGLHGGGDRAQSSGEVDDGAVGNRVAVALGDDDDDRRGGTVERDAQRVGGDREGGSLGCRRRRERAGRQHRDHGRRDDERCRRSLVLTLVDVDADAGSEHAAAVRAQSGIDTQSAEIEVVIGPIVDSVAASADPPNLPVGGGSSRITVLVLNPLLEPAVGVPVVFSATAGRLNTGGKVIQTDGSGIARALLRTELSSVVTATIGGGSITPTGPPEATRPCWW